MFDFVDLFSGVGGFHGAMAQLGGRVVQAAEIDEKPAAIYEFNWGLMPVPDVRLLAAAPHEVPEHAVLTGGFPCQPFSKSGRQRGMAEERGTLFNDILAILEAKTPPVVMLENVRNIAGPQQKDAWNAVVGGLRKAGYKVSDRPCVFSPHLLSPGDGGAAQIRERVYIMGVHVGADRALVETNVAPVLEKRPQNGWDPENWSVKKHVLLPELKGEARQKYVVEGDEEIWINTWNELLARLGPECKMPGFPMWEQFWTYGRTSTDGMPPWKKSFIKRNRDFYLQHRGAIDGWRKNNPAIALFPSSRRKLEWQAQSGERDLWKHLIQFRPSGIRIKRATYTPALVAMNQTPIYGPMHRRLTPLETARLQGFDPETFSFNGQADSLSYKQMGNAVNIGTAAYVFEKFVVENAQEIWHTGDRGRAIVETVCPEQFREVTSAA